MRALSGVVATGLTLLLLTAACAAPPAPGPSQGQREGAPGAGQPAPPKRVAAALTGDPPNFSHRFNPGGVVPGIDRLEEFIHSGLAVEDDTGTMRPLLADAVPTLENGLWKLLADGRMETRWTIKKAAQWHDGVPLTTADLLFAAQIEQDRELPLARSIAFNSIERIEAVDAGTLVIHWSQPYVWADVAFAAGGGGFALALPKHLLERSYSENKAAWLELPYWTGEYVGTGPFKVKEFVKSSHVILAANDRYALGRPKIDEIELKIIPDWGTLAANILAGTVEVTPGGRITLEWATQVRDQWRDGRMEVAVGGAGGLWFALFPQFLTPNPPIIGNVQFRRALVHAIDRQLLADDLLGGVVPPAHSMVSPQDAEYRDIEPNIMRYDYDPRRATQMIEALGYSKGPDGVFRGGGGERLSVEIRTIVAETQQKLTLSTVDFWRRVGVDAEPATIPLQLARDAEQYSTHPGFLIVRNPAHVRGLIGLTAPGRRCPRTDSRASTTGGIGTRTSTGSSTGSPPQSRPANASRSSARGFAT